MEGDIAAFDRSAQEGFLLSIHLPAMVVANTFHASLEKLLRPSKNAKRGNFWNSCFQRSAVSIFLSLYRDNGYFIPVPMGDFVSKYPRLFRLMVTDMLVIRESVIGGDDTYNRPPTNLCNIASIFAFCMAKQYHLYSEGREGAKELTKSLRKEKKTETEVFQEVRDEYGELLKQRFVLLPSKFYVSETLNIKWLESDKDVGAMVNSKLWTDKQQIFPDEVFGGLNAFALEVWAVPPGELEENKLWSAEEDVMVFKPRKNWKKNREASVPWDRKHLYTIEEIVHGIFVENNPKFDFVAERMDLLLRDFNWRSHFGYYWHHSDPVFRRPSDCLCPGVEAGDLIQGSRNPKVNEEYGKVFPPEGWGGFFPDFLFAVPKREGDKKRKLSESQKQPEEEEGVKKAKKNDGKAGKNAPKSKKATPKKIKKNQKKEEEEEEEVDDGVDKQLKSLVTNVLKLQDSDKKLLGDVYLDARSKLTAMMEDKHDDFENLNLTEESQLVAATTLMNCYLQKAFLCATLIPKVALVKKDKQGVRFKSAASKHFADKKKAITGLFQKPKRLGTLTNAMIKTAEKSLPGDTEIEAEFAEAAVPAYLAYKLGHTEQASGCAEDIKSVPDHYRYYRHLIKGDDEELDDDASEFSESESEDEVPVDDKVEEEEVPVDDKAEEEKEEEVPVDDKVEENEEEDEEEVPDDEKAEDSNDDDE